MTQSPNPNDWIPVATIGQPLDFSAPNVSFGALFGGVLRFLRWKVARENNTGTVTFEITGVSWS